MMSRVAQAMAVTVSGMTGHLVEVEAHSAGGLPAFTLVGLPDTAVREARERVRAALGTCGLSWGERRVTANLSPADLPKSGTGFDLALAMAILATRSECSATYRRALRQTVLIGELGLDGTVRPVKGILPAVIAAVEAGYRRIVVPVANASEARLVTQAQVEGVWHIGQVIALYGGSVDAHLERLIRLSEPPATPPPPADEVAPQHGTHDLRDVIGQKEARFALEVAAAGGHHLLFVGPPGAGKTMMAQCLPSILPPLGDREAVTVTSIHSVAGILDADSGLIRTPPFRAPHHTASKAAIMGGGSGMPRPGDISLAHCGVLFLDEAPEFSPRTLDCLRQPLEEGQVTIDRAIGRATYPASFQLILAANPCPCGRGSTTAAGRGEACTCTSVERRRYFSRLSGPLLDRVDIQVEVQAVSSRDLVGQSASESSAQVAARVSQARQRAAQRLAGTPWHLMGQVPGSWLRSHESGTPAQLIRPLMDALDRGDLSLRGVDRVLRLAWTLADLAGCEQPTLSHLGTALTLRTRGGRV